MVYKWRSFSQGVAADVAGKELERIEKKRGKITARAIVDESKPKNAALHPCFEWDNKKAADEYRLYQARCIVTNLVVYAEEMPEHHVRAFVNVESPQKGEFVNVRAALSNEEQRARVLKDALARLMAFKREFEGLEELANVLAEIDTFAATVKKIA